MSEATKPSEQCSLSEDQPSESEWTQLSIPDINHQAHPSTSKISTSINLSDPDLLSVQLLPSQSTHQLIAESDSSSTSFDPQAWKRGDKGTVKRPKRPSKTIQASKPTIDEHTSQTILSSSTSVFTQAAFIPPPPTARKHSLTQRSVSSQRRSGVESNAALDPSTSRRAAAQKSTTRPSSDVGPATKPHGSSTKPSPPTWKAYTGREAGRQTDERQDFLQALSNLRAMARLGRFEWLSGSSSGNEDERDTDEPRPVHADLPTSTLNSAVGEDDQPIPRSLSTTSLPTSASASPPSDDPSTQSSLPRWARWWTYVSQSFSLKTWQLLGLGGMIFGFGLCTGRLFGRRDGHYGWPSMTKLRRVDL